MQLQTTIATCPLCRVRVSPGHPRPAATRLCIDCQALVHTIVPNGKARAIATVAPQTGFVLAQFVPPLVEEHDFFDEIDEIESPAPAELENLRTAEEEYQPYYIEEEPEAPSDEEFHYEDQPTAKTVLDTGPLEMPPFLDEPPDEEQEPEQAEQPEEYDQEETAHAAATASEPAADDEIQSATDPWDDPLPVWEYSRREWPIIIAENEPSLWMRARTPLAIALALVCMAGLYYFVYRPLTTGEESPVAPALGEAATTGDKEKAEAAPADSGAASAEPATGASTVENRASAAAAPPAGEAAQTEGKYTLQVAALPDEASARDYSERLMRAGISTYIIPVENGRRRFFRVRAGRFMTADEAQMYAAQSRLRARAAGLTLNFMVVDYIKP